MKHAVLSFFLLLAAGMVEAQTTPATAPATSASLRRTLVDGQRHYWVDVALGASTLGALAGSADAHAELPRNWLVTGGVHTEASYFLDGQSGDKQTVINSFHLLGGNLFKGNALLATTSAGLALVQVHTRTLGSLFSPSRDVRHRTTVGIPIQVQGYLVALRTLGLGVTARANLNLIRPTASIGLSLAAGRMPTRRPPW